MKTTSSLLFSDFRRHGAVRSLAVLLALAAPGAQAQDTPEFKQHLTPYNLQSQRGVPISDTIGVPVGSDGRMPIGINESGTPNLPTPGQFQSFIAFGGIAARTNGVAVSNAPTLDGNTPFSQVVVEDMQLPRAYSNTTVAMVLRLAQVGAPYISRRVNFSFGSLVEVPAVDENGASLGVIKETYWQPEPFSLTGHTNSGYYYSPHARKVFAIQAGPLQVTWRKMMPYQAATVPTSYVNRFGTQSFETNGSSIYLLYTENYVVSGSAVKPPKKMYWTEREFRLTGLPVVVPAGRVSLVNVVYNNNFPRNVAEEYRGPGYTSPTEGNTNQTLQELRTLWYDPGLGGIFAYNHEGRAFVEFLGDPSPDGLRREHLGTEIVDVFKTPVAADITVHLGERLTPPVPGQADVLYPQTSEVMGSTFVYRHTDAASSRLQLYATRTTTTRNDSLVHWLEEGVAGIRWPCEFVRYSQVWPADVSLYSHYLRPAVATEDEAKLTAVPLSTQNTPVIEYQDALDRPRAKLTEDFKFYTFLNAQHPAHRTLLRLASGEHIAFERVFSWLDTAVRTPSTLSNSVAAGLSAWNSTNLTMSWPEGLQSPRLVETVAPVGDRIRPPADEAGGGSGQSYLAGHINVRAGILYHPQAYIDPFVHGFAAANLGAIIPVNAVPGTNLLEVWWFRTNASHAGLNAGNTQLGFRSILWPAVLGRYTVQWPTSPREIVLASKVGSGALDSFEARGTIYRQNNPALPGYNPNEEHAIMSGGQAFATRDDLNITNTANYSSHPFVLVQYTAQDGRPAISAFKVLREKPEAGWVFDYIEPAGRILQPPMPLPLLPKPVLGSGDYAVCYNTEPTNQVADLPGGWNDDYAASRLFSHYNRFTWRDRNQDFWIYRGPHAGLPVLEAGSYDVPSGTFAPLTNATAVVGTEFAFAVHASRQDEFLALAGDLPDWLNVRGLVLRGTPTTNDLGTNTLTLIVEDLYEHSRVTNTLTLSVVESGEMISQAPLALVCSNAYTRTTVTFSNRPPFLAANPAGTNSFTMRYYYKTDASFDWPGYSSPPPAGTIVPYLRPVDPATGQYVGDPTLRDTLPLEIVYRPVWPERDPKDASKPVPAMPFGATLTTPAFNLPGVRDMKTAHLLYQQSLASNLVASRTSVVLHDPTRAKFSDLTAQSLNRLPPSIAADIYQGRYYFPNLPPHLAERVYFDPSRGEKGSLVFLGKYVAETLGESYVLLNVLRGSDLAAVKGLCPTGDTDNKPKWDALVDALATAVETFYENPNVPGTYIPQPGRTASVGVGDLAAVDDPNTAVDSYAISATGPGSGYITLAEAAGTALTQPGEPVALHVFRVDGNRLHTGEAKVITAANPLSEQVTFQHTADLAGRFDEYEYEWKIGTPVDGLPPVADETMSNYLPLDSGTNMPRRTIGGAGIQALTDNYVVMRYRAKSPSHPLYNQWSEWTAPKLAEGWIKRVLAGINPFNQRLSDLFNNSVNTDASLLTQAGKRWEGDVALNLDTMNNYGLIEIYETVLRRGRSLSIESGYNYGPANDALLLAAGYLSDLYMMLGGEAWADAANPTIGIGTSHSTYGDIATALFAFKGQTASLLEEELALLRGRDDFLVPGVQVAPVYNRLVWNYTRGIDSGEVIYALNYNIQENPAEDADGVINAEDAAAMFPQGHGDAYGHYLTALKGYYSLLMNSCFDWVPRSEAVNVLGQPVAVDYQDERKLAAAAAAAARAGRQVFDLTWRKDFQPVTEAGWAHFGASRTNSQRTYLSAGGVTNSVARFWGMDHWACRTEQGAYLNWVVGNAILPAVDNNPLHEGIQKIDRTTVTELQELVSVAEGVQTALSDAEGGLSPLGVPEGGIAFDIDPSVVVGTDNGTHFEQIYQRAKTALNNAVASFDDAKDVTRLMRSEQDSLAEFQARVAEQEMAFKHKLIDLYGTPYPEDIGPGKTYPQGYTGPDFYHYMYVDRPEGVLDNVFTPYEAADYSLQFYTLKSVFAEDLLNTDDEMDEFEDYYETDSNVVNYHLEADGFLGKPSTWTGMRASPGALQQAASDLIAARNAVAQALDDAQGAKNEVQDTLDLWKAWRNVDAKIGKINLDLIKADEALSWAQYAADQYVSFVEWWNNDVMDTAIFAVEAMPRCTIAGVASGGDLTAPARSAMLQVADGIGDLTDIVMRIRAAAQGAYETATATAHRWKELEMQEMADDFATRERMAEMAGTLEALAGHYATIAAKLRAQDNALRAYRKLQAEGDRLLEERHTFRQRAAAVIQGYRTRDAAFRLFRNEKLERYKTLFDLAARYSLLAANAYDYETGLLGTSAGRNFKKRFINARALGVVRNGEPQYAGSNTGDPGLSSALAEMKADWDVLRGRLGFNNPDAYGTTVSLRTEALRILPTSDSDANWKDTLQSARMKDILQDPDVRRYCMQVDTANGLPVPGIVLTFSTTIADGYNLFGRELAAGDHAFTPSAFATKIFGVGVALIGYRGMDNPSANSGATGGSSPPDPNSWYLDPLALAATPYVYLIPVGVDAMRSPPLGDAGTIRTWSVEDVAIPMPFNLGQSDFSTRQIWQSSDALTEPLFAVRKHQAFRPVSTTSVFSPSLYGVAGTLQRSPFTNNRLVGRSAWNSQWKLVIPGKTLLNNPNEGLDRFIQTVTDIQLHFVTYSYSGN